jgi:hypothetical protein
MPQQEAPVVIGRLPDNDLSERAGTKHVSCTSVPYKGGAIGEVTVDIYRSTDISTRGGIVLRITSKDKAESFIAHAKVIEGGIELHMAGDIEGRSLLEALRKATSELRVIDLLTS